MKKVIILVACIIQFYGQASAQDSLSYHNKIPVLLLATTSVISGALGDGLNSRMYYTPGHILAATSYLSLLVVPLITHVDKKDILRYICSYILIRYALFDALYNIGAHRNLNYIGGKNYYDESVGKMPLGVFNATKIAALGATIYINIGGHKHAKAH